MKFKVREDLARGNLYGDLACTRKMELKKGKIIDARKVNELFNGGLAIYESDQGYFSEEMLELIENDIQPTKSILLNPQITDSIHTMISDAANNKGLFDPVNRPQHYADRKYEVIDVIEDSMSVTEFKGFLLGNVLKYVMRYDKKGGVQDLEKSNWYLQKLIEAEKEDKCEQ